MSASEAIPASRLPAYCGGVQSTSQPDAPAADPAVAATVRLLHHRQGWARAGVTALFAFALADGAYSSAQSQGTPPPSWFLDIVIALGALTAVSILGAVACTVVLRRKPSAVRAQARPVAARHPSRPQAHHYPPRHRVTWAVRWIGMLLIVFVAAVSVPAVVDGAAYLAGAGKTVIFDPVSYQTNCDQYGCQKTTTGILRTGGAGVSATWPHVVPLGRPFRVRAPVWRWGLGEALIDSNTIAVVAVLLSLLIEGAAVLVLVKLIRLTRNWVGHRRWQATQAPPMPVP
jgi:hypothetical protein